MNESDTLTDAEVMQAITAAFDATRWQDIVDITDAWLEARGELPGPAAHFRAAGLQGVGRLEEAVPWAEVAVAAITPPKHGADPSAVPYFAALVGLGQALAITGHTDKAMRVYREALRVPVFLPESMASKAHLRLAIKPKQWRKAWLEHEARLLDTKNSGGIPGVSVWDGKPTDGPVVVLHEQGIGDAVLFARWLPMVAERSGHPVIWVGETMFHRYIGSLPGVLDCRTVPDAFEEVDERTLRLKTGSCVVRAMSLPHIFDCIPQNIPAPIAPRFEREPLTTHRPLRVGVCWEGSKTAHHNFDRSLAPDIAAHLWQPLAGVEFVSLQYNVEPPAGAPFTKMPEGDLLATAERIASCDLVVTVDTSVFHVAASLNIPTLVLTPMTVDWRYTGWPGGASTLWYPSAIVIRRESARETEAQVRTARAILEALVEQLVETLSGGRHQQDADHEEQHEDHDVERGRGKL